MALRGRYVSVGRNDGPVAEIDLDLLAATACGSSGHVPDARRRGVAMQRALCRRSGWGDRPRDAASGARSRVPLADLPAAHAYMVSNSQIGKIVLSTEDGEG